MALYEVVSAERIDVLEERVEEHISEGWVLQGGVSVAVVYIPPSDGCESATEYTFAQAMVLESEGEKR